MHASQNLRNPPAATGQCGAPATWPTWLAVATLTAIARLVVVHRAILTRLRTTRLVCGETHGADQGCKNRKQNLRMIFHKLIVGRKYDEN